MAEAGGGGVLLGFGGRQIRRFGEGGDAVARELELIFDGENVGGPQVSVNEVFAVEKSESVQRGSENVARFGGSERALPKKLREILLGVFHQDVEQIEIAETAAAGVDSAQLVWMGKFGGVLPAR